MVPIPAGTRDLHLLPNHLNHHPANPTGTRGTFPMAKWSRHEVCHSLPPSSNAENVWTGISIP